MEKFEVEKIQKNLSELIKVTDCNDLLIAELASKKVLSISDIAELSGETNWVTKNDKFYRIVKTRLNGFKHLKDSLAKTNQTGVLKLLGEAADFAQYHADTLTSEPVSFNVLDPNILFTGREKELQELELSLLEPGSMTVISGKSCITGLGGIGKTDLARMLIQTIRTKFEYIIWINADSEVSTSKDFKTLAMDKFGISIYSGPGREKDISIILDDVYTRLALKDSLIIFDNVENTECIQKYFPKSQSVSSQLHILITSQDNDWGFINQISLAGLEPDDAVSFVKKGLQGPFVNGNQFDDDILHMVTRLQFFPLAIGQAIAFIRERRKIRKNYGTKEYVHDLDRNSEAVLKKHGASILTGYKKSTYETLELTLNRLTKYENIGSVAINLVKIMAFMAHDNIEDTIFDELVDSFVLEDAILLLERFSIVSLIPKVDEAKPLKINIHRLVQQVMRCILESENQMETTMEDVVLLIKNKMKSNNVDHAMSIWHHVTKLAKQSLIKHCLLPEQIFWILLYDLRLKDAFDFLNILLKTLSHHFDCEENYEFFPKDVICVAYILHFNTISTECKDFAKRIVDRALKNGRPYDPLILKLRSLQAALEDDIFDAKEGTLQKYCNLCNDWRRCLGDKETIDSLETLMRTGYWYDWLNRHEEANAIYQNVCSRITTLEIIPVNARRASYVAFTTKRLLALSCQRIGELDRAVQEFEQILSELKLQPDECTGELPRIHHDFALTLIFAGNFVQSLESSQFAYAYYLKAVYYEPVNFWSGQFNIALANSELDQTDAHKLILEVCEFFKSEFGEKHPRSLHCLALKGTILSQMGKHEDALQLLENAVNDSYVLDKIDVCFICLFKYYYVNSLVKSSQIEKALIHLIPLREQVLPLSDLFYIKPKVLKLCEELNAPTKAPSNSNR